MKDKILPTCLQVNCGDSLGEFSNRSYGVLGAEIKGEQQAVLKVCAQLHLNWPIFKNLIKNLNHTNTETKFTEIHKHFEIICYEK